MSDTAAAPTAINETDLIVLRRLLGVVAGMSTYSAGDMAEAKVLAEVLKDRFGIIRLHVDRTPLEVMA